MQAGPAGQQDIQGAQAPLHAGLRLIPAPVLQQVLQQQRAVLHCAALARWEGPPAQGKRRAAGGAPTQPTHAAGWLAAQRLAAGRYHRGWAGGVHPRHLLDVVGEALYPDIRASGCKVHE